MEQEKEKSFYFGGGGETAFHPATLVILFLAVLGVLLLPRRYAFIPLLVASLLIPLNQKVMILGLHFTFVRILLLFGWLRLLISRLLAGKSGMGWTSVDTAVVSFYLVSALAFFALWGDWGALVYQAGVLYSAFGVYFFLRYSLRDWGDLDRAATTLVWVMIVLAVFMVHEQLTGRNVFYIFGGVPEFTALRGDRVRSQGPFAICLTAGSFGATVFPLAAGLLWRKRRKLSGLVGIVAAIAVAVTSTASTSVLVLLAAMAALLLWPLRGHMRWVRWGVVGVLVGLHMVMKAPVWALIGRIDLTGSSSSYHRYQLVDQFIYRFGEWWLVGTRNTAAWGWDMWDTANTYVEIGTRGGLISLLLFLALLAVGFRRLGVARREWNSHPDVARLAWVLGAMLTAHTIAFFGISYFDQTSIAWYTSLAMISTAVNLKAPLVAGEVRQPVARAKLAPAPHFAAAYRSSTILR